MIEDSNCSPTHPLQEAVANRIAWTNQNHLLTLWKVEIRRAVLRGYNFFFYKSFQNFRNFHDHEIHLDRDESSVDRPRVKPPDTCIS